MFDEIRFERPDDETLLILVNRKKVFTTNHDEIGWAGMSAVERAVADVARELGGTVVER